MPPEPQHDTGYPESVYPAYPAYPDYPRQPQIRSGETPSLFATVWMSVLKRPWVTILTLFVVTIPSVFYVYTRPELYRATATVSTVSPTVTSSMGSLLQQQRYDPTINPDNFYIQILESRAYKKTIHTLLLESHPEYRHASDSLLGVVNGSIRYSRRPRTTGSFDIEAINTNPEIAKLLAEYALFGFQQKASEIRRQTSGNVASFIEGQLTELNQKLGRTEAEIQDFTRARGLTADDLTNGVDSELRRLQSNLKTAQTARDLTKKDIDAYTQNQIERLNSYLTISEDPEDNQRLISLRERLNQINAIDADSLSRSDSLAFARVQFERRQTLREIVQITSTVKTNGEATADQIPLEALEEKLGELGLIYISAQNQFNYHQEAIAAFQRNHPDLPTDILEFFNMTRTKDVLMKTIDALVNLREQKRIEMASETGGITVMDSPTLPNNPINANRALKLLVAVAVGFGLGILLSYLIDFFDNTVQNEGEIQGKFGLNVIGSVPVLDTRMGSHRGGSGRHKPSRSSPKPPENGQINYKQLNNLSETSPISEAYRAIKTSILFLGRDRSKNVFVVTSPVASDGKSLTTYNIAVSIAQGSQRVLIIDADLRRASQHKLFQVPRSPGTTDILNGQAELAKTAIESSTPNLFILPAGTRISNPGELVASNLMRDMIEEARGLFDVVLVDTPPITPCMDSRHLALMVGGMILVVRAERTKLNVLDHSINLCQRVNAEILGVIVNHATFRYGLGYYYVYQRYNPYGYYYSGYQYYYTQDPESGEKVRKKRRKPSKHSYTPTE